LPQTSWRDVVDADAWVISKKFRQGRAGMADQIDVDPACSERTGVILHPRIPTEIPYDNDRGAHFLKWMYVTYPLA
jgi:hypothetical protein